MPRDTPVKPDDTTISTTESEKLVASADNMTGDAAVLIEEIKGYVQAPEGYTPTKTEIEMALEAQESKVEIKEEPEESTEAQPDTSYLGFFFNPFSLVGGAPEVVEEPKKKKPAPKKGVVAQEMVRRIVVRKLMERRDTSAVRIQACARRMIAKSKMEDFRIMASQRQQTVEVTATQECLDDMVIGDVTKEEKKKGGFRKLFRRKRRSGADGNAPLLQNRNVQATDDNAPVQEKKSKGGKLKRKMRKMFSKSSRTQSATPQSSNKPPTAPKRMSVIITTPDTSVPLPEARAEAEAYHKAKKAAAPAVVTPDSQTSAPVDRAAVVTPESNFPWHNRFLADDPSELTSRTSPLLDSLFKGLMLDMDTLKEWNDDAVKEVMDLAMQDDNVKKDLNLIPENDWTAEDWEEARRSLVECSQEHYEEVTYQTNRFVSNNVTL